MSSPVLNVKAAQMARAHGWAQVLLKILKGDVFLTSPHPGRAGGSLSPVTRPVVPQGDDAGQSMPTQSVWASVYCVPVFLVSVLLSLYIAYYLFNGFNPFAYAQAFGVLALIFLLPSAVYAWLWFMGLLMAAHSLVGLRLYVAGGVAPFALLVLALLFHLGH